MLLVAGFIDCQEHLPFQPQRAGLILERMVDQLQEAWRHLEIRFFFIVRINIGTLDCLALQQKAYVIHNFIILMDTGNLGIQISERPQGDRKAKPYMLAKSIDHHTEIKSELLGSQSQSYESKNIFGDPMNLKLCQLDPNVGPKLENNKIVKRSIVGKPDLFKIRKGEALNSERNKKYTMLKQTGSTFRHTTTNSNLQQKFASGEELQQKISLMEKQLFQNQINDHQTQEKLPFEIRQSACRNQRALDNYFLKEKIQNNLMLEVTKMASRDPSKSVMVDLYKFRKRVEYASLNDSLHSVADNRQITIWQAFQLMNSEVDQDNNAVPLLLSSDRQELIRKPSIVSHDETTQSILRALSDDHAYNSFTSNDYIEEKYQKYKKYVTSKIQVNPDELIVFGQNKFYAECKVDLNGKYLVKEIDKETLPEPEIIAENYSGSHKLRYRP